MLAAFEVGSGALAALIAILIAVIILAAIVARMMKRDELIRIARIGVFIQRERLEKPQDTWTPDPLSDEEQAIFPAPTAPSLPPIPLSDEETKSWPQRKEGP